MHSRQRHPDRRWRKSIGSKQSHRYVSEERHLRDGYRLVRGDPTKHRARHPAGSGATDKSIPRETNGDRFVQWRRRRHHREHCQWQSILRQLRWYTWYWNCTVHGRFYVCNHKRANGQQPGNRSQTEPWCNHYQQYGAWRRFESLWTGSWHWRRRLLECESFQLERHQWRSGSRSTRD